MKIKNAVIGVLCLGALPFVSHAGAGFNVPACDAPAVIESAQGLVGINNSNLKPAQPNPQFKNIKEIKFRSGKTRTCVADIYNRRTKKYVGDYYYQINLTNGMKWVVGGID